MEGQAGKKKTILRIVLIISALTFAVAPLVGMSNISPLSIIPFAGDPLESSIFWKLRVPRVMASFLAGSALAVCGLVFQTMFRNPLATPFTLGTASGAALGAAIYVVSGYSFSFIGFSGITAFAFLGAVLSISIVYGLTLARRGFTAGTMLLAGVAVSFFFSSLILFIQYLADFTGSYRIVRWLMGGLDLVGFDAVLDLIPIVVIGTAIIFYYVNELNLIATGEEIAVSRGVELKKVRTALFFATSLMVGGVVSVCGPIGFIGMMAPHICRLVIGSDARWLLPATLMFGGLFLTVCDAASRVLIAPAELPVGIITALLGGPFFIWLLVKKGAGWAR